MTTITERNAAAAISKTNSIVVKALICLAVISIGFFAWGFFFAHKPISFKSNYLEGSANEFWITEFRGPPDARADHIIVGSYIIKGRYSSPRQLKITLGVSGKTISFFPPDSIRLSLPVEGRHLGPIKEHAFGLPGTDRPNVDFSVKFQVENIEDNKNNNSMVACGMDKFGQVTCPVWTSLPLRTGPNGTTLPPSLEVTVDDNTAPNGTIVVMALENKR